MIKKPYKNKYNFRSTFIKSAYNMLLCLDIGIQVPLFTIISKLDKTQVNFIIKYTTRKTCSNDDKSCNTYVFTLIIKTNSEISNACITKLEQIFDYYLINRNIALNIILNLNNFVIVVSRKLQFCQILSC